MFIVILFLYSTTFGAEFLIYNQNHWMDSLSEAELEERINADPHVKDEYISRLQRGDIIKVYPDGAFKHIPSKKCAFAFVKVPGLIVNKELQKSIVVDGEIKKERQYRFNLTYTKQMSVILTPLQAATALYDKSLTVKENEEITTFILVAILLMAGMG